ncbi:hypothetical protein ACJ41O_000052 [Fusarium nematophilum]
MFRYQSLQPEYREIRLARFVAGPDEQQGSYSLELVTASLNESPTYRALSYVWGDPTPRFPISVNGEGLQVAENLHVALGQLSRAVAAGAWLWIDAICIDQSNLDERSWQVSQMRDIYKRAESVYISLGDSGADSDLFLSLVDSFGQEAEEAGILDLWAGFSSGPIPDDPERYPGLAFLPKVLGNKDIRDHRMHASIVGLLERQNWCRAWTVQEITLAKRGRILCGEQNVSLDAFHAALTAIYFAKISGFARRQPQWMNFGSGFNNNRFHIWGLQSRLQHLKGKPSSLLDMLLSDMRATDEKRPFYGALDPRDVIFALLGVAADAGVLGIRPDYTKSACQVYTEATRAMILHYPNYRLEYCTFPKDTPGLPSWVPDWQRIGRRGVEVHPLSYGDCFYASRGRTQPSTVDKGGPTLRQRGSTVDSVAKVFTVGEIGVVEQDTLANALAEALRPGTGWTRCLKSILDFAGPYLEQGTSESSLWRDMSGGKMVIGKCTMEYDSLARRAFRQEAIAADSITEAQLECILRNSYPYPRKLEQDEDLQPIVERFCELILIYAQAMVRGRALFVTTRGVFGLGPYRVREGDVVTILFGTQVPIILRPDGDAYTWVGDAYVHGIMEGEVIEGCDELGFDIA